MSRRNYFALFSSNAELGGGKVGGRVAIAGPPLEGKFGRDWAGTEQARAMDPVNIVGTSACDGHGGTTSPPALTSVWLVSQAAVPSGQTVNHTATTKKKIAKSETPDYKSRPLLP